MSVIDIRSTEAARAWARARYPSHPAIAEEAFLAGVEAERNRAAEVCEEGAEKYDPQEGGAMLATAADLIRNPVE